MNHAVRTPGFGPHLHVIVPGDGGPFCPGYGDAGEDMSLRAYPYHPEEILMATHHLKTMRTINPLAQVLPGARDDLFEVNRLLNHRPHPLLPLSFHDGMERRREGEYSTHSD